MTQITTGAASLLKRSTTVLPSTLTNPLRKNSSVGTPTMRQSFAANDGFVVVWRNESDQQSDDFELVQKPETFQEIKFYDIHDIDLAVNIKINSLEGLTRRDDRESFLAGKQIDSSICKQEGAVTNYEVHSLQSLIGCSFQDLYVECQFCNENNEPLCIATRTKYKPLQDKKWEEWLKFPLLYRDLTTGTKLRVTVWDSFSPNHRTVIGSAMFPLFTKNGKLRNGKYKIKLHPHVLPDELGEVTKSDVFRTEYYKVDKLVRNSNVTSSGDWLDRITMNRLKEMQAKQKEESQLVLTIETQLFEFPVGFPDLIAPKKELTNVPTASSTLQAVTPNQNSTLAFDMQDYSHKWICDPEVTQKNLAEEKNYKLLVSTSNALVDRDLKPNAEETKRIQNILNYPPLADYSLVADKHLLWQFRYWLSSNKRALVKFLKCTNLDWNSSKESKEGSTLLDQWAKIDIVDALTLLSRSFQNAEQVRNYAVSILRKADDEEILDILLQLVQALRYEQHGASSELATFLIERASKNFTIANRLYWFVEVEIDDPKNSDVFKHLKSRLWKDLSSNEVAGFSEKLNKQSKLVKALKDVGKILKQDKAARPQKIAKFKRILETKSPSQWNWEDIFAPTQTKSSTSPLTLPLMPETTFTGIDTQHVYIFKSAMSPMLIPFKREDGGTFATIFKCGDDLRQDQLIIQMITLMDKLLKKNGLDLKLTPYNVMATGQDNGFVECITPNTAVSKIPKGDIRAFLKQNNGNEEDFKQACQNFVKSCAGYCVITYILGIGDRHLDNILMTTNGLMFHIDFGFILGRDPKPLAPPMKLCKEMVEGMGGAKSEGYFKFKELCCTAYNILRKSADLILNMFVLMADANIRDIMHGAVDPLKNIMKVQEKFRLNLNDAQAMEFMQNVIDESEKALFPQITETLHRWAQYWRS